MALKLSKPWYFAANLNDRDTLFGSVGNFGNRGMLCYLMKTLLKLRAL